MFGIKKIRHFTSIISLVAMVVLTIFVLRLTPLKKSDTPPIKWEPPQEPITQKPSTAAKRSEQKSVIPEPRKEPALPVSARTAPAMVPKPPGEEFDEEQLNDDDLLRENISDMLAWLIKKDFPEIGFSESEFQEFIETVMALRESMLRMRGIEKTKENDDTIIQMHGQIVQAVSDFKRITGMNVVDFLFQSQSRGGIDNDVSDDEEIDFESIDTGGP